MKQVEEFWGDFYQALLLIEMPDAFELGDDGAELRTDLGPIPLWRDWSVPA